MMVLHSMIIGVIAFVFMIFVLKQKNSHTQFWLLFVPSSFLVYFAGNWWDHWKDSPWRHSVMDAIMPISTGLILAATWIISKTSIHTIPTAIMGVIALCLMLFTKINPVLMMAVAGVISWAFLR